MKREEIIKITERTPRIISGVGQIIREVSHGGTLSPLKLVYEEKFFVDLNKQTVTTYEYKYWFVFLDFEVPLGRDEIIKYVFKKQENRAGNTASVV